MESLTGVAAVTEGRGITKQAMDFPISDSLDLDFWLILLIFQLYFNWTEFKSEI